MSLRVNKTVRRWLDQIFGRKFELKPIPPPEANEVSERLANLIYMIRNSRREESVI